MLIAAANQSANVSAKKPKTLSGKLANMFQNILSKYRI